MCSHCRRSRAPIRTDVRGNSLVWGLIAPSVTPLPSNPSYRIGKLDATSG
jgi:hypothetical protein